MRQLKIVQSITKRSDESLNKYLVEISRMPLISPEQEVELAQNMRKGGMKGEKAKEKLIVSNLRFVVSVAKQYQHQGVPLIDLINEGNIGLITAADKFDETRGFKFISYAIWWIRQSILQAVAEYSSIVRRPQSQVAISNKIKNATNAFLQEYQRYPSAEELSDIITLEIGKIEKAIQAEAHVAVIIRTDIDSPLGAIDLLYKISMFTNVFGEQYRGSNPNDPNNLGGFDKRVFRNYIRFQNDFRRYGPLSLTNTNGGHIEIRQT